MAWKTPEEMTIEEARYEMEDLENYFEECARNGDGISTKDSFRHRMCKLKVRMADELGYTDERLKDIPDLYEFEKGMMAMFAPPESLDDEDFYDENW